MIAARWGLALVLFTTQAFAADWRVVPETSSLRFSGVAQGEAFEGRFTSFTAQIAFDPAQLAASKFHVDIALASADTQNEERDGTLKESDFFDTAQWPDATFDTTQFVAAGSGFEARGTLTLRGVAKPATLAFTWTPSATGATLEGKATLDRTQWGVGGGDWQGEDVIAHEVAVATTLMLVKTP